MTGQNIFGQSNVEDQAGGRSQKPPKQRPVQHCDDVLQPTPIGVQTVPESVAGGWGASHDPLVQLAAQQSAPVVHPPLVGTHGVEHFFVPGSQWPEQQSASAAHVAVVPRHADGGSPHRGGLTVLSQRSSVGVARQHPLCGPELQVSPVGRQVEFAESMAHL